MNLSLSTSHHDESQEDLPRVSHEDVVDDDRAKNCNMKEYINMVLQTKEIRNKQIQNTAWNDEAVPEIDLNADQRIILKDEFPREVKLWFFISKVDGIDTTHSKFDVRFTMSATWIETDPKKNIKPRLEDGSKEYWCKADFLWHPQLRFLNLIDDNDENLTDEWFRVAPCDSSQISAGSFMKWKNYQSLYDANENFRVAHFMKWQCSLSQFFELENFPIDMQLLHIQVSSGWDSHNVLLSFGNAHTSMASPHVLNSQEFAMHSPRLISYNHDCTDQDLPLLSNCNLSLTGVRYSRAYFALTLTRNPQNYMWNYSVMLLILGSLSFTTFSIDIDATDGRLSNLFTLILAIIAFKLILANDLPAIAYRTRIDQYTFASIVVLSIISAGVGAINTMGNTDKNSADRWLFGASLTLWVMVNIAYCVSTGAQFKKRAREVRRINEMHAAHKSDAFANNPTFKNKSCGLPKNCQSVQYRSPVSNDFFNQE